MASEKVDVDLAETRRLFLSREANKDVVDALYDFGKTLLTNSFQRIAQQDIKLRICLGWAGALFGYSVIGLGTSLPKGFALFVAGLSAFSVYHSYQGLRAREWRAPSVEDWFQVECNPDPERLKRHYVNQMLEVQLQMATEIKAKGDAIIWAERLLLASVLLAAGATLYSNW